jgi:hypothetical protein
MRHIKLLILFFSICFSAAGQTSWSHYNDSMMNKTFQFYDSCKSLISTKTVTSKQTKIDKSLLKFANKFYNMDLTLSDLTEISKKYKNKSFKVRQIDDKSVCTFTPYTEGNIRIWFEATVSDNTLKEKKISIETKTKTMCEGDPDYFPLCWFDFVYINKYLLKIVNFPVPVKPYSGNLTITKN